MIDPCVTSRSSWWQATVVWLALLLAITSGVRSEPVGRSERRLTIRELKFDFGKVPQDSKVAHAFWLVADGSEEVRIINVKPGCGCTQAPLEKEYLKPGDSTRLDIIFSTGRYLGIVSKRPTFEIEGDSEPYGVTIISNVISRPDSTYPVIFRPHKLDISQYGEQVRDRAKLTITNVSGNELAIKLIDSLPGYGRLILPRKIGAGEIIDVELILDPAVLGVSFEKSFTIQFGDDTTGLFTVPVRRFLRDRRVGRITAPGR